MNTLTLIAVSALFLVVIVILGVLAGQLNNQQRANAELRDRLTQQLQEQGRQLIEQLSLQQKSGELIQNRVSERLETTSKTVGEVQQQLAQLRETNNRLIELGQGVRSLQQVLQAPKSRGTFGETLLERLLADILPLSAFSTQYRFPSGEIVDAVVQLRDKLVLPIDAKFPLSNFPQEGEELVSSQFNRDVKARIDEIARKYLQPGQGTLEIALMYVPAENVYYQSFLVGGGTELLQYAFSKHVIPVSPSSLYAYLQVILMGLRGMEVEERTREILQQLGELDTQVDQFREQYELVGKHLKNAGSAFESADKRLQKLEGVVERTRSLGDGEKASISIQ
jgi:DNA recombination protein RmuC